jgi:prophage regulatory protein
MPLKIVTQNPPTQQRRTVRFRELHKFTGLSNSTVRRLIRAGKFPSPFPLSTQAVGFDLAEIEAWIESRKATRQLEAT